MKIRRRYRSAYIVDDAKLRRIHGVLVQEFDRLNLRYALTFESSHATRSTVVVHTLDELLALDNSVKSRIRSLKIACKLEPNTEHPDTSKKGKKNGAPSRANATASCDIFYDDADLYPSVDLDIESDQTEWGHNLNSLLDEQIERTLQRGFIPRIKSSIFSRMMPIFLVLFLLMLVQLTIATRIRSTSLHDSMWLTESDVKELLAKEPPATPDDLVQRQLTNVREKQFSDRSTLSWLYDWRVHAAGSPILLVLVCILYLYFACYPVTVYNWGDMGDHFATLLNRRKLLWTTVVFGTLIGVVANVAVYGMVGLSSG